MGRVRTFRDLVAWQRAVELAEVIYEETSGMPDVERFGLTAQMRRSVVSIGSNIAEGYGRGTSHEFLRFLRIARGSLFELQTQFTIAIRLRMLQPHPSVQGLIDETDRVLQALIRSLEERERQET